MQDQWQRRQILIWGKTRPDLSKTHREVVCTGGVFADTKKLVRLYPIPLRYLDDEKVFKKYQWIEADVLKATSDVRPESYKIRVDNIKVLSTIPTHNGSWDERAQWIMQPDNIYQSVEALQAQQQRSGTSLGLVKPVLISNVRAVPVPRDEKIQFWAKYDDALRQMDLPLDPDTGREIKPLRPPDYRFKVSFRCDDSQCVSPHVFSILDWELDALYFRGIKNGLAPDAASEQVVSKLQDEVFSGRKDVYFYLGNMSSHHQVFTAVGLWWPNKKPTEPGEQLAFNI